MSKYCNNYTGLYNITAFFYLNYSSLETIIRWQQLRKVRNTVKSNNFVGVWFRGFGQNGIFVGTHKFVDFRLRGKVYEWKTFFVWYEYIALIEVNHEIHKSPPRKFMISQLSEQINVNRGI
jgi:hypothetical protein